MDMDGGDTEDMNVKGLNEDMLLNENEWRMMIHVFDPV